MTGGEFFQKSNPSIRRSSFPPHKALCPQKAGDRRPRRTQLGRCQGFQNFRWLPAPMKAYCCVDKNDRFLEGAAGVLCFFGMDIDGSVLLEVFSSMNVQRSLTVKLGGHTAAAAVSSPQESVGLCPSICSHVRSMSASVGPYHSQSGPLQKSRCPFCQLLRDVSCFFTSKAPQTTDAFWGDFGCCFLSNDVSATGVRAHMIQYFRADVPHPKSVGADPASHLPQAPSKRS